jgi:glyoxylase-like metal-dependent hydrolase (beta-lactamase superfamily II)
VTRSDWEWRCSLSDSDPAVYRRSLRRLLDLLDDVDDIFIGHGDPVTPVDVRRVQAAYEKLWDGRQPNAHEVDGMRFLVKPGYVS